MKRPHWRRSTWALIIWTVLILVWVIAGGGSAADQCADSTGDAFLSADDAQTACNVGAGIGIVIVLFIGFVGFVFLSLIWFMTRTRKRPCPVCGADVKKGETSCRSCGHDFAAAAAVQPRAPSALG
jgi:hypothetical protein